MANYFLRDLCEDDLPLLLSIELDPDNRRYSTISEDLNVEKLTEFIRSDHSLKKQGQLRQVIDSDYGSVGFIDMYDADFETGTAGIGILIKKESRRKGAALASLNLMANQLKIWGFKELFAEVDEWNEISQELFKKIGYTVEGKTNGVFLFRLNL
jgi:RimJ/RimL family protein N-acetyltransferase